MPTKLNEKSLAYLERVRDERDKANAERDEAVADREAAERKAEAAAQAALAAERALRDTTTMLKKAVSDASAQQLVEGMGAVADKHLILRRAVEGALVNLRAGAGGQSGLGAIPASTGAAIKRQLEEGLQKSR